MKRKYSSKDYSAEDLYREAQGEAKRSVRYKRGPAQIEVIKKYSGAARLFEEEGDFYKAKEVLEGAAKYLGGSNWGSTIIDPKWRKKINNKLNEINKKLPRKSRGLERRLFALAFLSIASFIGALFFISFNLTGYATGGLAQENFRWISTSLFILGLIFTFFYFKNKK
ncbi:hypothetical protein KAT24_02415 [Candidatus Pacearchaeota archaeon]|nr:hypothetical protein [Candidatus Pacearchaeota archaeon]